MSNNPNDNLKPFKSGKEWKGNRKGRPRGSQTMADAIHKWLMVKETVKKEDLPLLAKDMKLTQLDIIILKQLNKARSGDTAAFEALSNRYAGRPAATVITTEVEEGEGGNIKGTITYTIE